jgi:hypothetical protein
MLPLVAGLMKEKWDIQIAACGIMPHILDVCY